MRIFDLRANYWIPKILIPNGIGNDSNLTLLDFAAVYYRMRSHARWGKKPRQPIRKLNTGNPSF